MDTREKHDKAPRRAKFYLSWFYSIVPQKLGEGATSALMPLFIAQVLRGNVADVGEISAAAALAGVPGSIFWGNASDKVRRRKPFLLLGFLGFALSTALIGMAHSIQVVLIASIVGGLLSSAIGPVATALVVDTTPVEKLPEAFGSFSRIGGWSFVGGLLTGTLWLRFLPPRWGNAASMRGLFIFAALVAPVSIFLAQLWAVEPVTVRDRRRLSPSRVGKAAIVVVERALLYPPYTLYFILRPTFLRDARNYLRNALPQYYMSSFLLFFAINEGFVPFPLFLTDVLKATNAEVFLISLLKSSVDALFYMPMARAIRRHSSIEIQALAVAGRIGIFLAFAAASFVNPGRIGIPFVVAVHLFTGVTWAAISVSSPTAVASLYPKDLRGKAMGLYNAVIGAAGIVGSLAGGYAANAWGYGASFVIAALAMGITAVWLWRLRLMVPSPAQAA